MDLRFVRLLPGGARYVLGSQSGFKIDVLDNKRFLHMPESRTSISVASGTSIRRGIEEGFHRLGEIFPGITNSSAAGDALKGFQVRPEGVQVEVASNKTKYMRVSERDGHIIIDRRHLLTATWKTLYLDLLHELVHVKQFLEGKNLYDDYYSYVDKPTEVEAYSHAVKEGRRIGISEEEIREYLHVDWITKEEHLRLLRRLGVAPT